MLFFAESDGVELDIENVHNSKAVRAQLEQAAHEYFDENKLEDVFKVCQVNFDTRECTFFDFTIERKIICNTY